MKKNIAVIGCGYWGKNLVRNFAEIGALGAVCDPDTELAEFYAKKYNVKSATFRKVINDSDIEGIALAVPAPLHSSMALEAISAGKHVYVEKPLAMNKDEAELMILSAKENDVQLMVGHLLQYHPIYIAVRKMVMSGELGLLNYIYSNRLSLGKVRSEEDVIWSFAPHDISMILGLTGEEPDLVKTESSCILNPNISDFAIVHMKFKSGTQAHISVSWLHPYKEQKLVVIGSSAMAVFDDTKPWDEKLALYRHTVTLSNGLPTIEKVDPEYIRLPQDEPLRRECQHFVDVVKENTKPFTDGYEGLSIINVLSAASKSLIDSEEVRL